ncbi:unnamed protein product [Didymodactylos carnosus]|uniref:1-acyl-sn-glycerol-3-phosphate acyltransferase n=1 Tax=Didymodactylos carnosus TaxID=1234261 RepID=A0A813Y308_9BILA|nr:unnamed protein product [Didymodactylos carnosus]CAF0905026.1 unnamed protein product [Didymodactylos carnosus]CAF3666396.1 unnamed protein product [Didymodactylos carnosus]CAF3685061.1 unnamed protein product [Didymodactylos carnosus]
MKKPVPPKFDSEDEDISLDASQRSDDSSLSQFESISDNSITIEPIMARLSTISHSQTFSQNSIDVPMTTPISTRRSSFKHPQLSSSPFLPRSGETPVAVVKKELTYTIKFATTTTSSNNKTTPSSNNKRKRSDQESVIKSSSPREQENQYQQQNDIDLSSILVKTPDQSPFSRRKHLQLVQETSFRSPKCLRRSRLHETTTTSVVMNESEKHGKGDLTHTNPFSPELSLSKYMKTERLPSPRYETRLAIKRAAALNNSFQKPPEPQSQLLMLRELAIKRYDEEFREENLIGSGEFSHVYSVTNRLDGLTYAIKMSKHSIIGTSYEKLAWREACAHAVLVTHENIVRYYSAWIQDSKFYVQLEHCNGGALDDIIQKNRLYPNSEQCTLNELVLKQILHQIADALSYMHSKDIAHLDVKPANIMLCYKEKGISPYGRLEHMMDEQDNILYKLTDLGHVCSISKCTVEEDGDSRYLALEAVQKPNLPNLSKCDIFSLGLTLYVSGTNKELPVNGNEWQQLRLNINQHLALIQSCSQEFNDLLLNRMCNVDPSERPSAYDLLINPVASPSNPSCRETLRHSLKRERQKNSLLNKKLLEHYLLTTATDNNNDAGGVQYNNNNDASIHLLLSPTQSSTANVQHYASTPNDLSSSSSSTNGRLNINTNFGFINPDHFHLNNSLTSPMNGGQRGTYNLENKHFLHIDGPYIVVANHQSSIDFIGMMNLWTDHIKYCSVLAKKELLYAGPFGVTAWLAGVEFINRMNSKQAAITMKSIMEKIKLKNLRLWIFPEGTRNMDDEFRPFKSGAFRLAIQGQIPIIPVVFSSYKEIYSPNKSNLFWKNGVVTIRCLEPIETKHMTMDDFPQLTTTVREKMMKEFNMLKTIPDI